MDLKKYEMNKFEKQYIFKFNYCFLKQLSMEIVLKTRAIIKKFISIILGAKLLSV